MTYRVVLGGHVVEYADPLSAAEAVATDVWRRARRRHPENTTLEGLCWETAEVLVARFRLAGLEAYPVVGVLVVPGFLHPDWQTPNHGWARVLLPEMGWYQADVTLRQFRRHWPAVNLEPYGEAVVRRGLTAPRWAGASTNWPAPAAGTHLERVCLEEQASMERGAYSFAAGVRDMGLRADGGGG